MDIQIRKETPEDYDQVHTIIQAAFKHEPHSDHTEHLLVDRLRKSGAFIPELSLVAECNGKVVGHILLTKIKINNDDASFESLALAPISVVPIEQGKGIGGKLINEAHSVAKNLGYSSVILLGHEAYYPKFGYQTASSFGITLPFEVPDENVMAIELSARALDNVSGTVEYAKEFFE